MMRLLKEQKHPYSKSEKMEDMVVLDAIGPSKLKFEQKKKSLREVNLIKKKKQRKIKGRMSANGFPHRRFVLREGATSPDIYLEESISSMMTCSHKRRKLAIFNVPSA